MTGWRKSRACDGGFCVEAGHGRGVVAVRDSADRGLVLEFPAAAWSAFTARLGAARPERSM